MSDQIEISLPKTIVLEESVFPATAYFRTRATKAATAPTTAHYRVDCLTTGQQITDWTALSAAASIEITITATETQILEDSSRLETKQITVQADQGLSTQVNGKTIFKVRNLQGIS